MNYSDFINRKSQLDSDAGFDPMFVPGCLFDFQKHLVEWSIRKGRSATFADCGLGKTIQQLVWAQNVFKKTGKPVLITTPLAVSAQTVAEASKFGINADISRDGKITAEICITNYERLHYFLPDDFGGVACDESSILKNYAGATRNQIIDFLKNIKYRSLYSATPAPNDFTELGNSVEALGIMRRVEMLSMFFTHDGGDTQKWRLKGHGEQPFWRFMASWARAVRMPSDIGFNDGRFVLPELRAIQYTLPSQPKDGELFASNAITLDEQRGERRKTISARCEKVAEIAATDNSQFIAWCSLNAESEMLADIIDGAQEVTGSQSDEEKSEKLLAFAAGQYKCLVTKPDIAGLGMNFQNCHRMSFFPSHSYEQFYQAIRRCWRFGQTNPVDLSIVTTESEASVLENMNRKDAASLLMFKSMIAHMAEFYNSKKPEYLPKTKMQRPSWI